MEGGFVRGPPCYVVLASSSSRFQEKVDAAQDLPDALGGERADKVPQLMLI